MFDVTTTDHAILGQLARGKSYTGYLARILARDLQVEMTTAQMRRRLLKLEKVGLVRRVGPHAPGFRLYWELAPQP